MSKKSKTLTNLLNELKKFNYKHEDIDENSYEWWVDFLTLLEKIIRADKVFAQEIMLEIFEKIPIDFDDFTEDGKLFSKFNKIIRQLDKNTIDQIIKHFYGVNSIENYHPDSSFPDDKAANFLSWLDSIDKTESVKRAIELINWSETGGSARQGEWFDIGINVRAVAIEILGKNKTKEAVKKLIERLYDHDKNCVEKAIWALGEIQDNTAIPSLITVASGEINEGFYYGPSDLKREAVYYPEIEEKTKIVLEKFGIKIDNDWKNAGRVLYLYNLDPEDYYEELNLIELILDFGNKAKNILIKTLQLTNREEFFKTIKDALDYLIKEDRISEKILLEINEEYKNNEFIPLSFESGKYQKWLASAFVDIIEEDKSNLTHLIDAISKRGSNRKKAILILEELGEEALPAIPTLFHIVRNEPQFMDEAYSILIKIGPLAVPSLIEALNDESLFVRQVAVRAIESIGPLAAEAVPALIEALKDKRSNIRSKAVEALGRMGKQASSAIPYLINLLVNEQEDFIQRTAGLGSSNLTSDHRLKNTTNVIASFGKLAVPYLIDALKNRKNRDFIIKIVAEIGKPAASAIPVLIDVAKEELRIKSTSYENIPNLVSSTLRKIGKASVPFLIETIQNEDDNTRLWALNTIRKMGPSAAQAVPVLIETLKDNDERIREVSAKALGKIGRKASSSYQALINVLQDEYRLVRYEAVFALSLINPPKEPTISALIKVLDDEDEYISNFASKIIDELNIKKN